MKLTEHQKRINLLRHFLEGTDNQKFYPAPRRGHARTLALRDDGLVQEVGTCGMWGKIYAITPAGRAALNQKGEE